MDIIKKNILIGVLLILAGVAAFLVIFFWFNYATSGWVVVLYFVGFGFVAAGINSLVRLTQGREDYRGSSNLYYVPYCPRCQQELGGKEKRQAMRTGHCVCPKCGERVKWDVDKWPL